MANFLNIDERQRIRYIAFYIIIDAIFTSSQEIYENLMKSGMLLLPSSLIE